ncbi:MAG TPA: GGDEF domain-containing protein [Burkholderiaceae bacterium]|nr:GGDEF domain-containing protein [Burkholderiaceae bacterium]
MPLLPALHPATVLAVAALVMLACAAVMSGVGLTHKVYRGFWFWTAAQVAGSAVALLPLWNDAWGPARLASELALMLWSLLILEGVRRFSARRAPRLASPIDRGVFLLAGMALAAIYATRAMWPWWVVAFPALGALTLLYAAAVLWTLPERRRSGSLALLSVVMAAVALARTPRIADAAAALHAGQPAVLADPGPTGMLTFLLAAIVVLCLCLVMTHARTEHELHDSHRRLRLLANIDMLTSMPNRRHLQELTEELLSSSHEPSTLLLFDIDQFKQINERFGHAVGDAALRLVARESREALRAQDVLGRLGGDEFVALLPATAVERALCGADRITQRILTAAQAERLPPLTISVGVVTALPNESLSAVLARADSALYEAKRQGRGRAVLAEVGHDTPIFTESRALGLRPE